MRALYEEDETAWLELMARLAVEHRVDELVVENLGEFLQSMANRDRREVDSRLTQLLMHRLKWEYRPHRRSRSWQRSIAEQRLKFLDLLESGTLRNHAQESLAGAYRRAISLAAIEAGIAESSFQALPPSSIGEALKAG
jgi:hypothetical protein